MSFSATTMRLTFLLFSLYLLPSSAAWARCEGAQVLDTLHAAYEGVLTGADETRARSAKTLLVVAGAQSGERLGSLMDRAGIEVDVPTLSSILDHARDLATRTLAGEETTDGDFQHGRNLSWLSDLSTSHSCAYSRARSGVSPSGDPSARAQIRSTGGTSDHPIKDNATALSIAGLFLLSALAFGGWRLSRSLYMRARKVERLPRFPVSLQLDLTYTSPDGHHAEATGEALDISQGGAKIKWNDPPPPGTLTTLTLLNIQRLTHVIWANPHYAGVMFEENLTQAELNSLKDSYAPT